MRVGKQPPPTHEVVPCAFVHDVAHVPQVATLDCRFASHPFFPSPSQSPKPGLHVSTAHPALTQAAVPLAMLHVPPHVPQLRRSLRRSVPGACR